MLGGQNIKDSERSLIRYHADSKKGSLLLKAHGFTIFYVPTCSFVVLCINSFIICPFIGQSTISFAEFLELMGEILAETTRWGGLSTKLNGYVGFDTIQEQIRKKSLKRGFEFNLMVVG